jgi:hypothetical protein
VRDASSTFAASTATIKDKGNLDGIGIDGGFPKVSAPGWKEFNDSGAFKDWMRSLVFPQQTTDNEQQTLSVSLKCA